MRVSLNMRNRRGFTLVEMLVSLTILGILASIALPYAELTVKRAKEVELRASLRQIRTAIDEFHQDWKSETIVRNDGSSSRDGYPVSLDVLVDGAPLANSDQIKRYLRRIPRDPFTQDGPAMDHWQLHGYQDDPESVIWGGDDVYDVRVTHDMQALDGTYYKDW